MFLQNKAIPSTKYPELPQLAPEPQKIIGNFGTNSHSRKELFIGPDRKIIRLSSSSSIFSSTRIDNKKRKNYGDSNSLSKKEKMLMVAIFVHKVSQRG